MSYQILCLYYSNWSNTEPWHSKTKKEKVLCLTERKLYNQNLAFIKERQILAPPRLASTVSHIHTHAAPPPALSVTRRPRPIPPPPLRPAALSVGGSGPRLNRRRWRQLATAAAFLNSSDKPTGGKLRKPSAVVKKAKAWLAARLLSSAFCNALPFYLTACIMPLTLPLPEPHL